MLCRAAPVSRPTSQWVMSVAGAFGCFLCLCHSCRHLSFYCVEVEARAPLHWRELDEGLEFFLHQLLDEDETPELVLEPVEVLLTAFFRSIVWPARSLERIEAQVGDVRHVRMSLFTEPTGWLVDEAELVVVDAYCTDCAFAEVEDFMTC